MFVRWKTDKANRLTAVLVKSVRRDGKPRQKIIGYLASIAHPHEYFIQKQEYRYKFWKAVDDKLDFVQRCDDVTVEQRRLIENKIAQTVPRPTPKYLKRIGEEESPYCAAWRGRLL